MVARFLECAGLTHWLLHSSVQIFFCLVLVHKTVWCSLFSLSIQTGVLAVTFRITLMYRTFLFSLFSYLVRFTILCKDINSSYQF